jgi:polysaccharide pyruvyl transferase WcaK-like protein
MIPPSLVSTVTGREPRVLVLWADDASPNLGVRALATGTAEFVRGVWPAAQITFHNYGARNPRLPIGSLHSIIAERITGRRGMQDWFRGFDLVVDTRSGDSFSDIYGIRRLAMMTAVGEFARQAGVPVVLGPQTIGPFRTRFGRTLGRVAARRARLVLARDSLSASRANQLGAETTTLTTDVVFAIPQPTDRPTRDIVLSVSGLLWKPNPHVDSSAYRETLTGLHESLVREGRSVAVLAHVLESGNHDSDVSAAREFAAVVGCTDVIVPADLAEVRAVLAGANAVIGSRMHACLNALSVGTPAVPLAYSDKFQPLLGDLGWAHSVDLRGGGDVAGEALRQLASAEADDLGAVRDKASQALFAGELALARCADALAR